MEPAGVDIDGGDANRLNSEVWDSDSGLKPLQSDGNESDDDIEVEDMLPEEANEEIQGAMVDLMVELEDCDVRDFEWLPPKLRKRVVPKKIGMISFTARVMRELTMGSRRAEAALSWPRCPCKVGAHTATPQAHSCDEKSNETHRWMAQASTHSPGISIPLSLNGTIHVILSCCILGQSGGIVGCVISWAICCVVLWAIRCIVLWAVGCIVS